MKNSVMALCSVGVLLERMCGVGAGGDSRGRFFRWRVCMLLLPDLLHPLQVWCGAPPGFVGGLLYAGAAAAAGDTWLRRCLFARSVCSGCVAWEYTASTFGGLCAGGASCSKGRGCRLLV